MLPTPVPKGASGAEKQVLVKEMVQAEGCGKPLSPLLVLYYVYFRLLLNRGISSC